MALQFKRNKKRNLTLTILYRLSKLLFFLKPKTKLKLYLTLEWIFLRLAYEESYKTDAKIQPKHENDFLLKYITGTDKVLDLGCANGRIIKRIAETASEITGVDHEKKYLDMAKKEHRRENIRFVCDDIFNYVHSIEQNDFDVAILSQVIEHLENPKGLLEALSKKVGKIYVEVPDYENSFSNLYRAALDMDLKYTDYDHVYEFDRFDLVNLLEGCGLEIIDSNYRFGMIKVWCKS